MDLISPVDTYLSEDVNSKYCGPVFLRLNVTKCIKRAKYLMINVEFLQNWSRSQQMTDPLPLKQFDLCL